MLIKKILMTGASLFGYQYPEGKGLKSVLRVFDNTILT